METTTTTPFKSSIQLQTKKASATAFTSSLPEAHFDASEARYWSEKFGLGSEKKGSAPRRYAHPRKLVLQAGSSAVVHQVLFAPSSETGDTTATNTTSTNSKSPLAVVCGPRVKLYGTTPQSSFHQSLDTNNNTSTVRDLPADRQVQTGGNLALYAAYRNDARLLAVATDRGQVRIADATNRATLCTFSTGSHNHLPVRAVAWLRDGQHVFAAGDDGVARVWSLNNAVSSGAGSNTPLLALSGHGDAIRAAVLWQCSVTEKRWPHRSLAMTGSYDHTVRIWNVDRLESNNEKTTVVDDRCLSVLVHGGPVEALLTMPSSNKDVPFWLISAGGTTVKVWNPLTGTCAFTLKAQHRKTITSLLRVTRHNPETGIASTRIVTGALDGLLRFHSWNAVTGALELLHGVVITAHAASAANASVADADAPVAITSLGATTTGDRIAIGTAAGTVLVRQRGPSNISQPKKRTPRAGTYAFFTRGTNVTATAGDFVVGNSSGGSNKKRKLKNFDVALKQFRYGDALDEALETRMPQAVVAILEELGKRNGLTIALSNRDEESLEPILSFLARYMGRQPRYAMLLIGVANKVLDIYGDEIVGQSETIDELLEKLRNQVAAEARAQRKLLRIVGQLDAIVALSTTSPLP